MLKALGKVVCLLVLVCAAGFLCAFNGSGEHNIVVVRDDISTTTVSDQGEKDAHAFCWKPERKLTWDDFKGPVTENMDERTAAAVYHGIGMETDKERSIGGKIVVKVFNVFWPKKSWVREDEKKSEILAHEQCHFDICELYTRKLKLRLQQIPATQQDYAGKFEAAYTSLYKEYYARQQLYETETEHGLIAHEQQRWQNMIAGELAEGYAAN